jgi:predicted ATPase/class 3 adenylate cyclase/DNA-binding CsgD family transcriptional regulator
MLRFSDELHADTMKELLLMDSPGSRPFALPTGTVTFLLTDIEGSSARWDADPERMGPAVSRHYTLLDEAVVRHGGVRPVEQGEGDSIVAAFSRASDAIAAAVDAQRAIESELADEFRVRMAIHTGEAQLRDEGNYFGQAVIRCARLRALGHGGQILVSRTTADLGSDTLPDGCELRDLGEVRLRDLGRREHVFQLEHPDLPHGFAALRTLDSIPTNLPTPLTSLIGREHELVELAGLLREHRLVTLTGVGGAGKTRLAMQVSADVVDSFPDGVWWIELASLPSGDRVTGAVLHSSGGSQTPGAAAIDALVARLADRETLIVLDNCEHLLNACGDLVDTVLRACPGVRVLATSREPLGVPGELTWRIPSLPLPPVGQPLAPESVSAFDGVRLFIERARLARPHWAITTENAPAVADICQRLDGIPLAIELAAARVRQLSVEQVAAGLDDRFRLLTGGARTLLPRQQTLEASIEWSHELLDEDERSTFRSLGVFVGGFTAEAADFVASTADPTIDAYGVFELLSRLVDKSLIVASDDGRYRLLETMRSFALGRARAAGTLEAARDAHLAWAHAEIERWGFPRQILTPELDATLRTELGNIAAALEWSMRPSGTLAIKLLRPLARGWYEMGAFSEAGDWTLRLLDHTAGDELQRAWVCAEMVNIAVWVGHREVIAGAMEAFALADRIGEPALTSRAARAAMVNKSMGEAAIEMLRAGQRAARDADDSSGVIELSLGLSVALARAGRPDEAAIALDEVDAMMNWRLPLTTLAHAVRTEIMFAKGDLRGALVLALDEPPVNLPAYGYLVLTGVRCAAQLDDRRALHDLSTRAAVLSPFGVPGVLRHVIQASVAYASGDTAEAISLIQPLVTTHFVHPSTLAENSVRIACDLASFVQEAELRDGLLSTLPRHTPIDSNDRLHDLIVRLRLDDVEDRWAAAHEALALAQIRRNRLDSIEAIEHLAAVALTEDRLSLGLALLAAVETDRRVRGEVWRWPARAAMVTALVADHGPLPEVVLSLDEAIALAQRSRGGRRRPTTGWLSLTPVEIEVSRLVAIGMSNASIAERLIMSPNTVKSHLSHIFSKLGIAKRAELATLAAVNK